MAKIENVFVDGLERAIFRSGYPMLSTPPTEDDFSLEMAMIFDAVLEGDFSNPHIKRAISLANAKGGGHDQFLTGIRVDFDLTFSNKAWVEAERYAFLDFISSMSTMHRAATMDIPAHCNADVSLAAIELAVQKQENYKMALEAEFLTTEDKKQVYLELLYNLPAGFELMAGMTTNYRCLKNIYEQRRTHRLPDWQVFCDWVETLPFADQFITGNYKKERTT